MGWIDISLPISPDLAVWPGDPGVQIRTRKHLDEGATSTVSTLGFGAHTGTHIDAPAHFLTDGAPLASIPLDRLNGPCQVIDLRDRPGPLRAADLAGAGITPDTTRLLCRSDNSIRWARDHRQFFEDFIALAPDAARWLVEQGIRLIGIDALSVAPFGDSVDTHQILLRAGVVPLEGLLLDGVAAGHYQLHCLPLRLDGCEGAPARAALTP